MTSSTLIKLSLFVSYILLFNASILFFKISSLLLGVCLTIFSIESLNIFKLFSLPFISYSFKALWIWIIVLGLYVPFLYASLILLLKLAIVFFSSKFFPASIYLSSFFKIVIIISLMSCDSFILSSWIPIVLLSFSIFTCVSLLFCSSTCFFFSQSYAK